MNWVAEKNLRSAGNKSTYPLIPPFITERTFVKRFFSTLRRKPSSADIKKQKQLPLNHQSQCEDEKGEQDLAANSAPKNVNFLDAQDHKDRSTGHQILYDKKCERAFLKIISHDGIPFFRPTADQLKGEVSINNRKRDDAKYGGKNPWAMEVTKRDFNHFAIAYPAERVLRAGKKVLTIRWSKGNILLNLLGNPKTEVEK
jgi:hypothetical protein